jgi:hypothetical protein
MDASIRSECLPGTRHHIIRNIREWAMNPVNKQNVFWLHGLAGSGKSTLATTIASAFRNLGQLGAFLFFDRDSAQRREPATVIRTVAYQLGLSDARIGAKISDAVEINPNITHSPLRFQFLKLLVEPLSLIDKDRTETSLIIVLDAVDECGTAEQRERLLEVLTEDTRDLPSFIRFFITSRDDYDITSAFESCLHILTQQLDINSADNAADISLFFQNRTSQIRIKKKYLLSADWPGDDVIRQLTDRASGLFVWASTALRFIDGHDPKNRLDLMLKQDQSCGAESSLDALYKTALESVGDWDDDDFVTDFCHIMGVVLTARDPLSARAIDILFSSHEARPSMHTISLLGCVLTRSPTVHILHPSFADFLSDRVRCGTDRWFIDTSHHNRRLAIGCLDFLQRSLKRNICGLILSRDKVHASLAEEISYACLFWIDHLCTITELDGDLEARALDRFIFRHLLHWLEAMSILEKSRESIILLLRLLNWAEVSRSILYFEPPIDRLII